MNNTTNQAQILIVEDDFDALKTTTLLLEHYGYSVLSASNGNDGIPMAIEHQPDIIISDVNMPEMDGFTFFETLQSDPATNTIPFIFLSGRDDPADRRQGMALGADDFLTKPFNPEDLLNTIKVRLSRQRNLEQKYTSTMQLLRENITYALPHELRTPLTGILGYGELLKMDYQTISRNELREFAAELVKFGNRLHHVIENYLVYAQLEIVANDPNEIQALRRHLVVADRVIEVFVFEIASRYDRTSDIQLNLEENLGIRISETNLGKIVREILDNCCKFSKTGTPITINAYRQADDVILEFKDEGRGMEREEINRIGAYMQFQRGLYEQQGMGLGLPIVLKIAEIHLGDVNIKSQPNMGTIVAIRFRRR